MPPLRDGEGGRFQDIHENKGGGAARTPRVVVGGRVCLVHDVDEWRYLASL